MRVTVKAREVRYGGRSWKQGESFEVASDKDARLLTQLRNAPCVAAAAPTQQAAVREPVFEPPKPNPLSPPRPAAPAPVNRFGGRQPTPRAWVQPNVTEEDKLAAEKDAQAAAEAEKAAEANRYVRRDMRAEDE